ncbi:MAG: ABC transporter permease subunit [Mariprofundaceae bacterium]
MNIQQWQAICSKEWRVAIDTPRAYVVAVAFLVVTGFFFSQNLFLVAQADMRGWFSMLSLLLIFFIPAMAMRLLAGEYQTGTFELLATMPVRTIDVVLGKYLALLLQLTILLLLTLFYPLTLSSLGSLDWGQLCSSYLSVWLLAAAYSAVCLYASALTRYELVAYIVGLMMLLMMFLLSQAMLTFIPAIQDVIFLLSPSAHYHGMLRGLISLSDVMFFITMSGLFLVLTWFQMQRRRWR